MVNRLTPPLLPHTRRIKHERRGLLSVHNPIIDSLTVRLLDSGPSRVQNATNEPGMSMKTKHKVKMSRISKGVYGPTKCVGTYAPPRVSRQALELRVYCAHFGHNLSSF